MRYLLDVSPIVVEANSLEEALGKLAGGVSRLERHAANGTDIAGAGWVSVEPTADDAEVTDFDTIQVAPYPTETPSPEEVQE